jgi:hypothetical protein
MKPTIVDAPDVDLSLYPIGAKATRCTGCEQIRVTVVGDLSDPWKKHFDYCEVDSGCEVCVGIECECDEVEL